MITTKEDQIRAEFEKLIGTEKVFRSQDTGQYNYISIEGKWRVYKACAESYEKKLAEKDAPPGKYEVSMRKYADMEHNLSEASKRNAMLVEALETADRNLHWRVSKIDQETITAALEFNSEAVAAYEREVTAKAFDEASSIASNTVEGELYDGSNSYATATATKLSDRAEELRANKVKGE